MIRVGKLVQEQQGDSFMVCERVDCVIYSGLAKVAPFQRAGRYQNGLLDSSARSVTGSCIVYRVHLLYHLFHGRLDVLEVVGLIELRVMRNSLTSISS
jgi:hypothetical protein